MLCDLDVKLVNSSVYAGIFLYRLSDNQESQTRICDLFCMHGSMFKRKRMDSLGNLIDKLTIINIRIWMAEDIKRAKDATDKQIADATRITNIANQQRNNLIEEIDKIMGLNTGQGSTKMYGKTI